MFSAQTCEAADQLKHLPVDPREQSAHVMKATPVSTDACIIWLFEKGTKRHLSKDASYVVFVMLIMPRSIVKLRGYLCFLT